MFGARVGFHGQSKSDYLSGLEQTQRRAEKTVVTLIQAGHWAGWLTLAGGCIVLASYVLDIEAVWRPLAGAPATHPLTALMFIASGLAVISMGAMRAPPAALFLMLVVGAVALFRIAELGLGGNALEAISPFGSTLAREAAEGTMIEFGGKAASMFALVALAFLLRDLGLPILSQMSAAAGMAPPLIALTGYIYGVEALHGAMSATTILIGLCLSSSALLLGARAGIVRAISSPWDSARYCRFEIAVIGTAIFVGGLAVDMVQGPPASSAMALFIVIAILVATTTIAYSTITTEKNDRTRRAAERAIAYLVQHDPLSGLYNRRYLKQQQDAIIALAQRLHYRVCVLMIDIDNFKCVNDTYGHLVGDEVIQRVAAALKARLRCSDVAVRYGGEELVGVILDTDIENAVNVADGFRASIASGDFSDMGIRAITVSIGVAEVANSLTEAIARADVALYLAKASGRNRVVADQSMQRVNDPLSLRSSSRGVSLRRKSA